MYQFKLLTKTVLLVFTVFYTLNLNAQEDPEAVGPVDLIPGDEAFATPDVTAFQKRNFMPVNLYTGRVDLTIPLYTITEGNIEIPISISYNGGGIKVDEYASNVGLGWNLNASGVITRVVKDIFDFEYRESKFVEADWDLGCTCSFYVSQKGYFRSYEELRNGNKFRHCSCPVAFFERDLISKEDSRPDVYMVNAPGLSTNFSLNKITNSTYEAQILDASGAKVIVPSTNYGVARTSSRFDDFNNFTVKGLNGLEYTFADKDKLTTKVKIKKPNNIFEDGYDYSSYISSWSLNKIKDYKTNREVNFIYETYSDSDWTNYRNLSELSNSIPLGATSNVSCTFNHIPEFDDWFQDQQEEEHFKASQVKTQHFNKRRVKRINYSGGSVEFSYLNVRLDVLDENSLDIITIRDKNNAVIKTYSFNYDYFLSKENCLDRECRRLKLTSIDMYGKGGIGLQRLHNFDYYYDNPLPKVYSLQKDFLGYYNNNGISTPDPTSLDTKKPTLYYHKNNGANSVLPFPLSNQTSQTISGDFSLQPNLYSLSALLKKVTYPEGGYAEFEYENHRFNLQGAEYTAGGARISKQKLNDGNGKERVFTYEYKKNDGTSSGYINNIPTYGLPQTWKRQGTSYNWINFAVFDKSQFELELTQGTFVGYSRVVEREQGNGYVEHTYTSPNDYPNESIPYNNSDVCVQFLNDNSNFFSNFLDKDVQRGRPIQKNVYNQANEKLRETNYEYHHKVFSNFVNNYTKTVQKQFSIYEPYNWEFPMQSKWRAERNLLYIVIDKEYFPSGTVETEKNYVYDPFLPLLKESITTNSLGDETKNIHSYVNDLTGSNSTILKLKQDNRLGEHINSKSYKNGVQLSEKITDYKMFQLGNTSYSSALPEFERIKKGSNVSEDALIYQKFDGRGNPTQYIEHGGSPIRIVWGYNGMYPIAKIANAPLNDSSFEDYVNGIVNASNLDNSNCIGLNSECNEASLRYQANRIRTDFPDTKVSSYTYDPLIGITSMTDVKGIVEYYQYDHFGRLVLVQDQNGAILKKIDYKYKD